MDRFFQVMAAMGAMVLGAGMTCAQEASPSNTGDAPAQGRAMSPKVAKLLAAALPKFEAVSPSATKSPGTQAGAPVSDKPANGIVRLPNYVVREPRLPTAEDVMTDKARARVMMNRYLGPEDGFDRGALNLVTLAGLWRKIPVLGRYLPCPIPSMTNEERAMMLYSEDEQLRKMNDLSSLLRSGTTPGVGPADEKTRREIQKAFMHESEL